MADVTVLTFAALCMPFLAAVLAPLRAFRAGRGDWDWYARQITHLRTLRRDASGDDVVREAINTVLKDLGKSRPDLSLAPGD